MSRISHSLLALALVLLAGCGNGKLIGSGPTPTSPPVTPNVSYEYAIPTAGSNPATITSASNGFLYFTEQAASKIGELTTGGVFAEIPTVSANEAPTSIIVGPNNFLWWTQTAAPAKIASLNGTVFATTTIVEYTVPWANSTPVFLTRGVPNGSMYFTDSGANAIGEISTAGTFSGPFTIPTTGANPQGIAIGPDNKMWFTEYNAAKIGVLDPVTNTITEYPVSAGSHPDYIVQGSDGAMWFTENISGGAKLGRMTSTHQYSEFPLTGATAAVGLVVDLFGNLDVTDPGNSAIGVFTMSNQSFKEYPTKTASADPLFLTIGPDGKLYFTEFAANKIGQFTYF